MAVFIAIITIAVFQLNEHTTRYGAASVIFAFA